MSRSLALLLSPLFFACAEAPAPTLTDEVARGLATAASDDDFVVPMNDVIQARLVMWTSERREFTEASLGNRASVDDTIAPRIAAHGLPSELFAVAFVESGFSNIPERPDQYPGAGVWQFIGPTARTYGLRVDDTVDQRLDLPLETDAAMRLLGDLHAEFGDWGLAFAGYNQGSKKVNEVIAAEGTDDVWELIRRGALYPYAAEVMSAVIVLEDPEALGLTP